MTPTERFNSHLTMAYFMGGKAIARYKTISPADLEQGALLGLWRAATTYDEDKGPWQSYAFAVIYNSIIDTVRWLRGRRTRRMRYHSIEPKLRFLESDREDTLSEVDDEDERRHTKKLVRDAISTLDGRDRVIATMLADGVKQRDIANTLGLHFSRVSQLKGRLKNSIRAAIQNRHGPFKGTHMRVVVTGGRMFNNESLVEKALDALLEESKTTLTVVHGGCSGADSLANAWAYAKRAAGHDVRILVYPAEWGKYGKAAGIIRNQLMLMRSSPDLVLAFPGGSGTKDCIARAESLKIPVRYAQDATTPT